jgi:hypothetical protein
MVKHLQVSTNSSLASSTSASSQSDAANTRDSLGSSKLAPASAIRLRTLFFNNAARKPLSPVADESDLPLEQQLVSRRNLRSLGNVRPPQPLEFPEESLNHSREGRGDGKYSESRRHSRSGADRLDDDGQDEKKTLSFSERKDVSRASSPPAAPAAAAAPQLGLPPRRVIPSAPPPPAEDDEEILQSANGDSPPPAPSLHRQSTPFHPPVPVLSMPGYETLPSKAELSRMKSNQLRQVKHFAIKHAHGTVEWEEPVNLVQTNLDDLVLFPKKSQVEINREKEEYEGKFDGPMIVTLYDVKHSKMSTEDFERKLKEQCEASGNEFLSYDAEKKEWKFRVPGVRQ